MQEPAHGAGVPILALLEILIGIGGLPGSRCDIWFESGPLVELFEKCFLSESEC